MRLYINNQEIDLPDNVSINYVKSSSFLNPLQGTYTFPFSLRATPNNAKILNYPHIPQIAGNAREEFSAELWVGSFLLVKGTAKIVSANESIISITLEAMPANILKALWQKNIREFDLGGDTIPDQAINYTIYKIDAFEKIGDYVFVGSPIARKDNLTNAINTIFFKTNIQFQIGSTTYINETVEPAHAELIVENYASDIFKRILDSYNEGQSSNQVNYDDKQLLFIFEGNTTANLTVTFTFFRLASDDVRETYTFVIAPQNIRTITNYLNNSLLNTWTKPYYLPEITNIELYAEASVFNGVINKTVVGNILRNNSILYEKSKYSLVPMLKLKWVIEQLFSLLNFEASGSFLSNADIQKILIFNLFTLDKLIDGVSYPINIYNPEIRYANHLPSMKLSDFLQALIDQFAIGIEFNSLTGMVEMFFVKDIFNGSDYLDLTDRISFAHDSQLQDLKKKQLKWNASGDDMVTDSETIFHSFPTDSAIESEKDKYQPLELQFPSLVVAEENSIRQIPEIKQNGVSPLFGQSKVESPKRLLFWENGKADNVTTNMRLSLYGSNNIKDLLHTEKLSFDNNYLPVKAKSLLTIEEIASFQFRRPVVAYNVIFFAEDISVKITKDAPKYEVEFKLRRYVP